MTPSSLLFSSYSQESSQVHLSSRFGHRNHWEYYRCLRKLLPVFLLYQTRGSYITTSLSVRQCLAAEQLRHSSSNAQGNRSRPWLEDISWNQLLHEADGTSTRSWDRQITSKWAFFFFFISPFLSHSSLFCAEEKDNARLATRRVISPVWKAAMDRWGRQQATSQPGPADIQEDGCNEQCIMHILKDSSLSHSSHETSMDNSHRQQNPCP